MSLQPRSVPPIPDLAAQVARQAFRKGSTYMKMRDGLGTFFTDDQFAAEAGRAGKKEHLSGQMFHILSKMCAILGM